MKAEKTYYFKRDDYDANGRFKSKYGSLFTSLIKECEIDFYNIFMPIYANSFYSNSNTMLLFQKCFHLEENQIMGMESVNGEFDLDMNFEISKESILETIFAIACQAPGKEDEPLYLIIDDRLANNVFELKHISETGEEESVPSINDLIKAIK